ncbi:PfaB family protein [Psychromonas sp. psych-6C06]|nr:PfaB family protein [Psychromonas sp. psych-6C06]
MQTVLSVIGFNAIYNDLHSIDHVEASLYYGDALSNSTPLTGSYSELCKRCATPVLLANQLSAKQVAVLVVQEKESVEQTEGATQAHFSYESVHSLSDALLRSEQIICCDDVAVLIISASLNTAVTNVDNASISFDSSFNGYASLQGSSCLLLSSAKFAQQQQSYVYASINNSCTSTHANMATVIKDSLNKAGLTGDQISGVEVSSCINKQLCDFEQQALLTAYSESCNHTPCKTLTTAVSCHKSVLGEAGMVSQLMGLIHTVIALQQRYRPAIKDWQSPQTALLDKWLSAPFYLFNQAAPVFTNRGNARTYAYSLLTDQTYSHVVLHAEDRQSVHANGFMSHGKQALFIVGADDQKTLLQRVEALSAETNDPQCEFKDKAKQCYQIFKQGNFNYHAVFIAQSWDELTREIKLALNGIKQAFIDEGDWKTPKGSYFSSVPNKNAKTAFLYPGIGATYVGLGRDLFHLFPAIYPHVIGLADDISASLKDELLNPRSVLALDFKTLKQRDLELRNSLANIAECGVGYACVFTKIFEQVFKLNADFASGYSMGEVSMFAALGCWHNPGLMSERLANSDTFNHQLSSELRAIRKLWDLPDINDGEFEQIWETYTIKGSVEQVNAAIKPAERVYITIVNTPDSLVIGGFPADCLQVIERLGVRAMPLNMANAIHSEPAYQEYDNMLALYNMPVTERISTKMISSSCYLPIPQHQKAIAVSIAKCLCERVDFPRLIDALADKQAQVFIEMGAGRSLSSWTDKILKGREQAHLTVPVNAKGTDDQLTYARAVAKLISFGVAIDIECFFSGSLIQQVSN